MISIDNLMKDYRLKSTIRYNNRNKITNESVAEHSFYVALYTLEICNSLNLEDNIIKKAVERALLHDMVERDISDIPHDVKNIVPGLKIILENKEKELNKEIDERFNCNRNEDDESALNKLIDVIVKISDNYSVYQFCLKEQELGNNSLEFKAIENRAKNFIESNMEKVNEYLITLKGE